MIKFTQFYRGSFFSTLRNSGLRGKGALRAYFPLLILGGIAFGASIAYATATPTAATGGLSISADTTGAIYTNLTGPIITEGATADIGVGTIVLNAPTGFIFAATGTPTVLVTRTSGSGANNRNINDLASGSTIAVATTSTTLAITITAATSNAVRNSLTWQNVRVRPSAGTPLASGNILKTGTSVIAGVTNSVTNLGTLTEVVGAKNKLGITTQPSSSATSSIDFGTKPVVKLQDQFGNTVTTDSASTITRTAVLSTQTCGGTSGGGTLTSTPLNGAAVSSGVMTYTVMTYTAAEGIKICFTSSGVTSVLSNAVSVAPVATAFVIYAATSTTVDAGVVVTVKAQKPDGSVDANYQEDVTLVSSGASTGGGLVAMVNGIGTKTISDTAVESVHLSLTDTESIGLDVTSSADVLFGVGDIAQLSITDVASIAAGERASYIVTRKDQYGNLVTTASTTVYLFSSSLGAQARFYDAASGGNTLSAVVVPPGQSNASFWYYDETLGSLSITVSDNASSPNGAIGVADAVDTLTVTPGPVAQFTLTHPGEMTAYTRAGYTMTRKDQFGNLVTSGVTTAFLFSSASGVSTSTVFYDAASGGNIITSVAWSNSNSSAVFWYADGTPGTYTITASDNNVAPDGASGTADATDVIIVQSAPIVVSRFVIVDPINTTVDNSLLVTVRAEDSLGNVDTSASGTVTLITSGAASGGGVVTLVSGVGTKTIADHTAETVTLSLSDSASTGLDVSSSQQVVFAPGAIAQFIIDNPGDMAAGTRLGFLVTRKDQYGNPVISGSSAVFLYTGSTNPNARFFGTLQGGSSITSVMFLGGQSTVNVWYYDETSASTTVSISDNATAPDGATGITDATRTFFVTPASVAQLFLNDPGNMTSGTRIPYTLTRKDQFGNLVSASIETVYLYTSSAEGTAAFYDVAVGGAVTTIAVFSDGQSSLNFWYFDDTPGVKVITASDGTPTQNGAVGIADAADSVTVALAPIVPTRLVIQPTSDTSVGVARIVTVRVEDNSGNVDTTFNGSATLLVSGTATGGGLMSIVSGIGTLSISDTMAETVTLSLSDTGLTLLDVSSTRTLTFTEVAQAPSASGGGGGGGDSGVLSTPAILGVQFAGTSFRGARLNITPIGGTGASVSREVTAGTDGRFALAFTDQGSDARSYGIYATDKKNRITQVKILDAHLANAQALLSVSRILLSPTLGVSRAAVTKGDVLYFDGSANPQYAIVVEVDNQPVKMDIVANAEGLFSGLLKTEELSLGSHTVRVRQVGPYGERSDYSPQHVFSVVNIFTPNLDYNRDGSIGISDWSIFVSRWLSTDVTLRNKNDLNGDGKIDVQDFSIFIKTLKPR